MLGHQLGQNLILGLDLLFQSRDAFLFGLTIAAVLGLEGGGSVLKELLLPAIENRRLQRQLVAELRKPAPSPPDAASGWRPSLRLCTASVLFSCVPSVSLTAERSLHFQLRRDTPAYPVHGNGS